MKEKELLYSIATIANRSKNQCDFLFILCDSQIEKYIKLECELKVNFPSYVPANKEALDKVLNHEYDDQKRVDCIFLQKVDFCIVGQKWKIYSQKQ